MVASKSKSNLPKNAAEGKRFAIVVSRYHEDIAEELLSGAQDFLKSLGAKPEDISVFWVPGAFEIPAAAQAVSHYREIDAIICLGLILKGETTHHEHLARIVTGGIAQVHTASGTPAVFGVLTTNTLEQAKARSGGSQGNKGAEAAEAAIAMIHVMEEIKQGSKKQNKSVGF